MYSRQSTSTLKQWTSTSNKLRKKQESALKGVYVLMVSVDKPVTLRVGALGTVSFDRGLYAYVGSAQGNLEKRVERHLRKRKKLFWHIDYLLDSPKVRVDRVLFSRAGRTVECRIAKRMNSFAVAVKGFGSSDCDCVSHLFRLDDIGLGRLMNEKLSVMNLECEGTSDKGWCVWVTGLPGSGKSVVSQALIKLLRKKGVGVQLLSSDSLRKVVTPRPSYSLEERDAVYATLVYIARLLTENGVNVVIDSTGNLRRYRDQARKQIPRFLEAYLECPLKVCVEREAKRKNTHHAPKHIYERAKRGKTSTVPGVGQPYEEPSRPELVVDTTECDPGECAKIILGKIAERFEEALVNASP